MASFSNFINRKWLAWTHPLVPLSDQGARERSRLMSGLFLVVLIASVPMVPIPVLIGRYVNWPREISAYALVMDLFLALCYYLSRRGHPDFAIRLTALSNSLLMYAAIVRIGGQLGLELMYYLVLHMFISVIFSSLRFAVFVMVFQVVTTLVVGVVVDSIPLNQVVSGPLTFYLIVSLLLIFYFYYFRRLESHRLQQIEASEARYRAIVEDQTEMICRLRLDKRLTITFANRAYMEMFSFGPEHVYRIGLRDTLQPSRFEALQDRLKFLTPDEPSYTNVDLVVLPDGRTRWHYWHDRGLFDSEGRLTEIQSVGRDITEEKRSEEQAAELARERERVMALQTLIGDVSHDLMTPLTVIASNLHLVGRVEDHDRRELYVERAREQVMRLQRMIKDMVNMSRLDRETGNELELSEVALQDLLTELVRTHQPVARLKQQTLVLGSNIPNVTIRIDENRFHVAISNLIDNALKYTPDQGSVRVSAQCFDGQVRIKVADNGGGIPPEDLPHIFERFYRGESHRPANSGTGLGLSITRKIVELHHGQIEVQSIPNQGTIFTVKLPVVA